MFMMIVMKLVMFEMIESANKVEMTEPSKNMYFNSIHFNKHS